MPRHTSILSAATLCCLLAASLCSGQWTQLSGIPVQNIHSLYGLNEQQLMAGSVDGLLVTTNGGGSWNTLPITLFGQPFPGPVYDLHFKDAQEGYAVGLHSLGDQTVVLRTQDGGVTWDPVFDDPLGTWPRATHGIAFASSTVAVTVGTSGKIQRTTTGGASWYLETSGTTSHLYDVRFVSATVGIAVGANVFVRTTNGGDTWTTQSAAGTLRGISFSNGSSGFAIGDDNLLYRTTNSGGSWQQVMPLLLETIDFTSVHAISGTELYATSDGRIWHSTDAGLHWEWYPSTAWMTKVVFTPGGTGFAMGHNGELRRLGPVNGPYTPSPYFTLSPTVACEDSLLYCTNGSVSGPSFTWLKNGVPFSTQTDASVVLNTPAQSDTIGLVATSGALADTAYRVVQVAASLVIGGDAFLLNDTVCTGQSATVRVAASQSGTGYRLYRNGTSLGAAQNGNGGNLNFSAGVITANDTVVLVSTRTVSGCGTATASDTLTIFMATPSLGFSLAPEEGSLCYGESTSVMLSQTALNTSYQLYRGATAVGLPISGTGGAIALPTGPLTSTTTFNVRATHASGCQATTTATATIEVQDPRAYFTLTETNPVAGEPVDALNSTDVPGATFVWNFGTGAEPQTSTATSPTGIVFGLGVHDVQLTVTSPAGCAHTRAVRVHGVAPLSAVECRSVQGVLDDPNINIPSVHIHPETQEVYAIVNATEARHALFMTGRGDTLAVEMPLITYPNSIVEFDYSEVFVKFSPDLVPQWGVPLHHNSAWSGDGDIAFADDGSVYMVFGHNYYLDSLRIHSSDGNYVTIDPSVPGASQPIMLVKYDQAGRHLWHRSLTPNTGKYVLKVAPNGDLLLVTPWDVRRMSSLGDELWTYYMFATDLEFAPNGDLWVIGRQAGTQAALVRLSPDGTELFVAPLLEQLSSQPAQVQYDDIAIDGDGLIASGRFEGRWVFGPDTLEYEPPVGLNYNSSFIARFDFQGIAQWAHQTYPSAVTTHRGAQLIEGRYFAMFRTAGMVSLANGSSIDQGFNGQYLFSANADGSAPALHQLYSQTSAFGGLGISEHDLRYDAASEEVCAIMQIADDVPFQIGDLTILPSTPYERNSNLTIVKGPLHCFTTAVPAAPYSYIQPVEVSCTSTPITLEDASSQSPTAWSWSMPGAVPDASTQQDPVVTYALPGVHTVTLTASNASGTGTTYTAELLVDVCTAVSDHAATSIRLAPVPANDALRIDAPLQAGASFAIVDLTGRTLYRGALGPTTYVPTAGFPAGCYVLLVEATTGRSALSFPVAH